MHSTYGQPPSFGAASSPGSDAAAVRAAAEEEMQQIRDTWEQQLLSTQTERELGLTMCCLVQLQLFNHAMFVFVEHRCILLLGE